MGSRAWAAVGLSASGLVGGFVGQLILGRPTPVAAAWDPPLPAAAEPAGAGFEGFEPVARHIAPAVVSVDAVKAATPNTKGKNNEESGSGVLVKIPGHTATFAVTNNHVVTGARPEEITVTLSDGLILRPSRVWTDPESDVALLKLDRDGLVTADLGDSDKCRPGQVVLAFGSPFGFNQTVTMGILSARDRGQISLGNTIRIKEFLQTDAAINPGSSGGPLVDVHGRVIGINTAIASNNGAYSGVAFSIPINLVKRIGKQLLEKGYVTRGYLGMQLAPGLEPMQALKLGLDRVHGALVESVHPTSPAATGGVRPGDVVLALESIDVRDENHMITMVSSLTPNQRVKLTIWRDRKTYTTEVTVGEWTRPGR
jgi:S1-C subfamily serine protease